MSYVLGIKPTPSTTAKKTHSYNEPSNKSSSINSQRPIISHYQSPISNIQDISKSIQPVSLTNNNNLLFQPKLRISQPGDAYEQEADRVAEKVMSMPSLPFSYSTARPVEKTTEGKGIDQKSADSEVKGQQAKIEISRKPSYSSKLEASDQVTNEVNNILSSGSSPLDANTKGFMEARLGYDLSKVRIHTDAVAAKSAKSVNALAYTVGNDIVFAQGQYQPNTTQGKTLLAHELVHVLQGNNAYESNLNAIRIQRQPAPTTLSAPDPTQSQAGKSMTSEDIVRLRERLRPIGIQFLDEWFSASTAATNSVPEPNIPGSQGYWFIALAGNLLWAATSLLDPELTIPIRIMSFVGAAVGSGTLQQLLGEEPGAPAGRPLLVTRLAKVRDAMNPSLPAKIEESIIEAINHDISNIEEQDQILWTKLLPGVPYEHRFEFIVRKEIEQTSRVLEDFKMQYIIWRNEIDRMKRIPMDPGEGIGLLMSGEEYGLSEEEAVRKHPFNPVLKFEGS